MNGFAVAVIDPPQSRSRTQFTVTYSGTLWAKLPLKVVVISTLVDIASSPHVQCEMIGDQQGRLEGLTDLSDEHRELDTFAARFSALVSVMPGPNGRPWSHSKLATAVTERGVSCSRSYMQALAAGERDNPSAKLVQALADVLGVNIVCLLDADAASTALQEITRLQNFRTSGIQWLLARTVSPNSARVSDLDAIIDRVIELEGEESDGGPL